MPGLARRLLAAVSVVAACAVALIITAPNAIAHHAEITATTKCGYAVEWTATSWAPGEKKGSHPHILVEHQLNGSGGWTKVADQAFTTTNGSFSGSFVAPGTPTSVRVRVRPDANYKWENGQSVSTDQTRKSSALTFPNDCDEPSATAYVACAAGGVAVSLKNDGTTAAMFDVTSNGAIVAGGDDVKVNGGTSTTVTVAVAEDATTAIVVMAGNDKVFDQSLTRNCVKPLASFEAKCASGGAVATLENDGESAASFEILVDGTVVKALSVNGGATVTEAVTLPEGKKAVVTAKEAGTQLASLDIVPDCFKPAVATAMACASGGAAFTFSNPAGQAAVSLTVKKEGDTIDTVVVDPDKSVVKTYAMAEDATASFRVTGPDFDSGAKPFTLDCFQQVASTTTTAGGGFEAAGDPGDDDSGDPGAEARDGRARGGELPKTGSTIGPLVLAGLALAAGGIVLVGAARVRSRRTTA